MFVFARGLDPSARHHHCLKSRVWDREQQKIPRSRCQAPEMLASFTHYERRRNARFRCRSIGCSLHKSLAPAALLHLPGCFGSREFPLIEPCWYDARSRVSRAASRVTALIGMPTGILTERLTNISTITKRTILD
jgi:hypothetical protein